MLVLQLALADRRSGAFRHPQPTVALQESLLTEVRPDKLTAVDFRSVTPQSVNFAGVGGLKLPDSSNPASRPSRRSVRLAARVVPWHTFNLIEFGAFDLQARHA